MKEKPNALFIFVIVVGAFMLLTHIRQVDSIPFVEIEGGAVTVDIGDFYYYNSGCYAD